MQVRARSKHRASIPFRPLFTVLLLSLPVVFIFFFSVLLGNDRLKTEATTIVNLTIASNMIDQLSTSSHDTPIVTYEKVLEYSGAETYRYAAFFNEAGSKKPLSIRHWAELMTHNSTEYSSGLGRDLSFILKEASFPAFRFETKGCHKSNFDDKQFEFVLVKDSFLASFAASADKQAFAEHFKANSTAAVVFDNLGGDARLIVPQPLSNEYQGIYGHCANFMRKASTSQIVTTWKLVVQSFLERIEIRNDKTVWLSTAGTGVAWLHFRLDDRPKYYLYQPFANEV